MAEVVPNQSPSRVSNRDALLVGLVFTPIGAAILAYLGNTDTEYVLHIDKAIGALGVVALGAGVGGLILAFARNSTAPCPKCGQPIEQLAEDGKGSLRLCRGCSSYLDLSQPTPRLVERERLEAAPVFRTNLPRLLVWPEGCCVCRAPATRKVPIQLESSTPLSRPAEGAVSPGPESVSVEVKEESRRWRVSLEVPHCEQHADGAALSTSLSGVVRIGFRSLAYLLALCEKNDLQPR